MIPTLECILDRGVAEQIIKRSVEVIPQDGVLFRQGQRGDCIYFVKWGEVALTMLAGEKEIRLYDGEAKSRVARKTDFAKQDANNHRLGRCGEEWVVCFEKKRLIAARQEDLAEQVDWVRELVKCSLSLAKKTATQNE